MYNLRVGLEQVNTYGGDVQKNCKIIIDAIQRANSNGAELIVFPELAVSGYGADDLFLKTKFLESCQQSIQKIAQSCIGNFIALVGYPEKFKGTVYSSVAIIHKGKIIANHRKRIIPDLELYTEHRYFKGGTTPTVIEFKGVRIGVVISEELFDEKLIPECDLICCSAAFPWARDLSIERSQYLHYLARERKVPIIYVNQVGIANSLLLEGCSSITNEEGNAVVYLRHFDEDASVTSMSQLKNADQDVFHKADNHTQETCWALYFVIKEFMSKTYQKKALVLLDGSINSKVTLYLAVKALGADKVSALFIKSHYDSSGVFEHSRDFTERIGIELKVWTLSESVLESFTAEGEKMMGSKWEMVGSKWEMGTIDRIKATIFTSVAESMEAWPLSSVDKTQIALGIKDYSGSFALSVFMPLSDLYHRKVIAIAEYLEVTKGTGIFSKEVLEYAKHLAIKKAYINGGKETKVNDIDEVLYRYIEKNQSTVDIIAAGYDEDLVDSIIRRLHKQGLNRNQAGFSPKVSSRAFQTDWRFPVIADWDHIDMKSF